MKDLKTKAKKWINANVFDGDDRSDAPCDSVGFNAREFYELINDLVEYLEEQWQMNRRNLKRAGEQMFCPDIDPCFIYMGRILTCPHEKKAWIEGWYKAKEFHDSMEKEREKREKMLTNEDKIEYLLIAIKNQHQPHMDWIDELDMTVSELIKKVEEQ